MTLRKPNFFSHINQTALTTSSLSVSLSLDGRNVFPSDAPTGTACRARLPPTQSNPVQFLFRKKICYFRMTEIFSQLRRGAEICKYVFGSVPVTMFSWCFFPNLKLFITIFGGKKKKRKLYVNLSKEIKLAIKFRFYIHCLFYSEKKNVWQFEMSKSKI